MDFDGRFNNRNFGPWKRRSDEQHVRSHLRVLVNFGERFNADIYSNMDLNIQVKQAALKVSPSVVSVVSRTLRQNLDIQKIKDFNKRDRNEDEDVEACPWCSGTIISCEEDIDNASYIGIILTSGSVLRGNSGDDNIIDVYTSNGKLFVGEVYAFDFHYNIAAIKIRSEVPLPVAIIRFLDDSINIDPDLYHHDKFQLRPHSDLFKLLPGEMVVAVGRHFAKPYELMAAPGQFSLDVCHLDCHEVSRADCTITKCGIGGPLVNQHGEVIGVNFIHKLYTPFLPINIACKILEHFKKNGRFSRPWLGMVAPNLYSAKVAKLEKIIKNSPIRRGVIVEKVISGSPADRAGILRDDVIIGCNGKPVHNFLELLDILWDKIGESVELVVLRLSGYDTTYPKINFDVTSATEINRWPIPQRHWLVVEQYRRPHITQVPVARQ